MGHELKVGLVLLLAGFASGFFIATKPLTIAALRPFIAGITGR